MFNIQSKGDILLHGQPWHGRIALKNIGKIILLAVHFLAVQQYLSRSNVINISQAVQKCGFTTTRRANNAKQVTAVHIERHVIQDKQIAKLFGKMGNLYFYFLGLNIIHRVFFSPFFTEFCRSYP